MRESDAKCLACGSTLSAPARRDRETFHTAYCEACLQGIREGKVDLTCVVCHVPQPAERNFERAGNSRTGYLYSCKHCARRAAEESTRLAWLRRRIHELESQHAVGELETREREARRQAMQSSAGRYVLHASAQGVELPPDQVIYTLVDPRNEEVRYVGQTHDPKARLKRHLRLRREESIYPGSRAEWIASLRAVGLRPAMIVVEEVEAGANVYERERRWMFHYLRQGACLTNGEATTYPHLFNAARAMSLDYLTEPVDSGAWCALFDAWWEDSEVLHRAADESRRNRLIKHYEAELLSLQMPYPSEA